jgi:thioredoxin
MLTLLDFYADWCGPCKMMAPTIEEIAKEFAGKLTVKKVNVDSDQALAQKYGVQSIPTLILLKDDKPVKQWVGVQGKEELVKGISAFLSP